MARPRWKRWAIAALKCSVAALVLCAVGRQIARAWGDLRASGAALRFEPSLLAGAGVLYLAGLSAFGRFFERVLRAGAAPIGAGPALRAYLVGHLGKYVPGKAMVVVLRAYLSAPFGARASTAAVATIYETLVMMVAGGLVSALGFGAAGSSIRARFDVPGLGPLNVPLYRAAAFASLGVGLALLVLVLPATFSRMAGLIAAPLRCLGPDDLPSLSAGLLVRGLAWATIGWLLLGASLFAVIGSFEPAKARVMVASRFAPLIVASVAFATVAGFAVAVLPGGLGVREGALISALAPVLGADHSVVAALVLRLVWMAAEIAAALVLLPCYRKGRGRDSTPPREEAPASEKPGPGPS